MSQTMLFTKRLSIFLNNSATPQLHTLLLISPTGKLLSSSSPSPASALRAQATLACSIWNLYCPLLSETSSLVSSALPRPPTSPSFSNEGAGKDLSSIMIQLEYGIMVIRSLRSGLLFVAVGPSSSYPSLALQKAQQHELPSPSPRTSPPASSTAQPDIGESHDNQFLSPGDTLGASLVGGGSAPPSEVGSVGTSTSAVASANILGVRRQAEELGKWVEEKLHGFVLSPPDAR